MTVGKTHPDYDANAAIWSRARDVLSGEDAVKVAGEKYLPRLDSQSDEEYSAYKARASFFGATARTLEEYLDLIFRRAPVVSVERGARSVEPEAQAQMRGFVEDCDLWGIDLIRYARQVVREVLSVGRFGSLVLLDDGKRPWVSSYRTEDILNWRVERVGQGVALAEVVLQDKSERSEPDWPRNQKAETERVRVLRMEREAGSVERGACWQEFWRRENPPSPEGSGETSEAWVLEERTTLKREDAPLPFIPFVFHGPRHSRPDPDRLPLADIITANLDHYRLDADFKHGLHFAALPTAWVSGFDKATPLRIGSSAAWVSDIPGATAGFLEFSGAGLAHIEKAMEKVERRMALLGARMLEVAAAEGEGNGVPAIGQRGELCGLGNIVASLNQSLSRVLQLAHWWIEGGTLGEAPGVAFTMNTDLSARAISGESLTAVVAAWQAGAISRDSMLEVLKRGEVLPEGRTVAQERALIHGRAG